MRRRRPHYRWLQIAFAVAWTGGAFDVLDTNKNERGISIASGTRIRKTLPTVGGLRGVHLRRCNHRDTLGRTVPLSRDNGQLESQKTPTGLGLILIVVVPSLIIGIFLKGLRVASLVGYLGVWLPLLFALWLSIRAQCYDQIESLS